jgi:asparagine synthase (glutamine-hydrolysing)
MFNAASRLAPLLRNFPFGRAQQLWPDASAGTRKALALLGSGGEPFTMYSTFRAMLFPDQIGRLLQRHESGDTKPEAFDEEIAKWGSSSEGDSVATYSAFELTNYLRNTLLRDMDVMGMAHGLEIREPLLDHHLVERLLTLPAHMKLSRRRKKPLLVDAVPALPRAAAHSPKMGFTLPFQTWLRGPLRSWAEEQVHGSELLTLNEVSRIWSAFDRGKLSYSRVWTLIALLDWTRRNNVHFAS